MALEASPTRGLALGLALAAALVLLALAAIVSGGRAWVLAAFAGAYAVLLALQLWLFGGFKKASRRRLRAVEAIADAALAGDWAQRLPAAGKGAAADPFAAMFNRLLDHVEALIARQRRATDDMAHDLRAPLQRLRSSIEQALAEARGTPAQARLERVLAELDTLQDLCAALLSISAIEGGAAPARFAPVDFCDAVAGIVDIYRPAIVDSGRFVEFSGAPVMVRGDRTLLQQLVANLLDNALAHTPAGTHIAVTVLAAAGSAVLKVSDDGPGIPPAERQRVFERRVRLAPERPGHGLGLNLVEAIATAHGGAASIEPSTTGLVVRVRIPAIG